VKVVTQRGHFFCSEPRFQFITYLSIESDILSSFVTIALSLFKPYLILSLSVTKLIMEFLCYRVHFSSSVMVTVSYSYLYIFQSLLLIFYYG